MCTKGFFRRMVPFFAAFAIGVFIASFFVTIGGSRFRGRGMRYREARQLRMENQQLRQENMRLNRELSEHMKIHSNWEHNIVTREFDSDLVLPVPPPAIPFDPAKPARVR